MALRKFRPLTPTQRFRTVASFDDVTRDSPEKSLTQHLPKKGGRDNRGHISAWQRGGGHKRLYLSTSLKRDKPGMPAKMAHVENDPNRNAPSALLNKSAGAKGYMIAPPLRREKDSANTGAAARASPRAGCIPARRGDSCPRERRRARRSSPTA